MVRCKLAHVDVNGRKRRQGSTMLNFQGQHFPALPFQSVRKAPKVTKCRHVDLHGEIYRRLRTYTLMSLYIYARHILHRISLEHFIQRRRQAREFVSVADVKCVNPT